MDKTNNRFQVSQHIALATFIFPDSDSKSSSPAPTTDVVPVPSNASAQSVPFTPNLFSPFSHDSSLAYIVPFEQVSQLLRAVQEIPDPSADGDETEQKKWIMRAARGPADGSTKAVKLWFIDAWGSFVDVIKVPYLLPGSHVNMLAMWTNLGIGCSTLKPLTL